MKERYREELIKHIRSYKNQLNVLKGEINEQDFREAQAMLDDLERYVANQS